MAFMSENNGKWYKKKIPIGFIPKIERNGELKIDCQNWMWKKTAFYLCKKKSAGINQYFPYIDIFLCASMCAIFCPLIKSEFK